MLPHYSLLFIQIQVLAGDVILGHLVGANFLFIGVAGILHARLGNMRASVQALEEFIRRAPEGMARHQAAAFLQQVKSKLN